jgi:hypothetical protein
VTGRGPNLGIRWSQRRLYEEIRVCTLWLGDCIGGYGSYLLTEYLSMEALVDCIGYSIAPL